MTEDLGRLLVAHMLPHIYLTTLVKCLDYATLMQEMWPTAQHFSPGTSLESRVDQQPNNGEEVGNVVPIVRIPIAPSPIVPYQTTPGG